MKFQKLTPKNDVNLNGYEEAFNFVFENDDVRNVAISGAYSSGKSSVLESYKIKHKENSFLHISLTHFITPEEENQLEEGLSNNKVSESILEGKILNQLIHQIPMNKIPQTSFKAKQTIRSKDIMSLAIWVIIFVLGIAMLFWAPDILAFTKELSDNWVKNILTFLFCPYARIISGIICTICSVRFIYKLIEGQKLKTLFRKISFQGNEIEIFEGQDDSYFDKYLNEVLYLFENVDEDVIVFEDIDRFNETQVFEHLREINNVVNTNRKKPLRFFYLIRDDIFTSKDRTKFFDYIIPIIPVIDSSNSYEQLVIFLGENITDYNLDKSFLQKLSLYIDDMRLLKNICNEFTLYINILNTTDLNPNKMMSMITYKNLFPRDFSDLQLARGFVYELFAYKPILIEQTLEKYESNKQEISDRIEWAKKEVLISHEELEDAYKAKNDRLSDKYRNKYDNASRTEYATTQNKNKEDKAWRKQAIKDNLDNKLPELESNLVQVNHDIDLIRSRTLSELITRENISDVFAREHKNELGEINDFKEIKRSEYFDLLKFLIWNGYIDETYSDYMSYFYPGSISANDKKFLRRITDRRGHDYSYHLNDPKAIVESPFLSVADFRQEEVLNFCLFEYLLLNNNTDKNANYLQIFISQLNEKNIFDFVSKYYAIENTKGKFVSILNQQWPGFFSAALYDNSMPSDLIRRFSIETLYFSNVRDIIKINADNCLSEYISQKPDYLSIEQPDIDKLISCFKVIGVSFVHIDFEASNIQLFDEVYENNLYEINFENVKLMLKKKYDIESDIDIIHKNYSKILSKADSALCNYISENLMQYLGVILDNCEGKISDDENSVIDMLNNQDIEDTLKIKYIGFLVTAISDITSITSDTLWKSVMQRKVLCFSSGNCLNYFIKNGLDHELMEYINESPKELDFANALDEFTDDLVQRFCNAIVKCNNISTDKYKNLLCDMGYVFNAYDARSIEDEKIEALIDSGLMQMNTDSIEFMRENYPEIKYSFIKQNFTSYMELQDEIAEPEEILTIIDWNIDSSNKLALLKFVDEPISIVDKNYSDEVAAYILSNNYEQSDIVNLLKNFSHYSEQTRAVIFELTICDIESITSNMFTLDDNLLSLLLKVKDESITMDQKLELFGLSLSEMDEEQCMLHLGELGMSEINNIFSKNSGRRRYENNEETTAVFEILKTHGWITEYYEDEKNPQKYVVKKNKNQ